MGRAPCCEKVGLKRGRWTAEEDEILRKYIHDNGEGSWRSLPKNAGLKRCGKSCRLRWMNYLRDDLKRGNISADEDDMIIKLHNTYGNRWSLIAGELPGRTDNEIKNYWNSHLSRQVHRFRKPFCEIPLCIMDLEKIDAKKRGGNKLVIKKKKETRKANITKKESKLKKKVDDDDDDESITPIPLIDMVETLKEVSPAVCQENGGEEEEEEKGHVLVCTDKDKEQSETLVGVGLFEGLDTDILGDEWVVNNSSNGVICISSSDQVSGEGENGERYCYNTTMSIDEWTNWDWDIVEDAHNNHTVFDERDEMFPWLWNTENDWNGKGESEIQKALAAWLLS